MSTIQQTLNQKICDDMTQLQADLEGALKKIFEQAGSQINPDRREEVTKAIEGTKQMLERFKTRYTENILAFTDPSMAARPSISTDERG